MALDLAQKRRSEVVLKIAEINDTLNENTARVILEQLPGFTENLAYNVDLMQPEILAGVDLGGGVKIPAGMVDDNTITGILMFLQANGYPKAREPVVRSAIQYVSRKKTTSSFLPHLKAARKFGKVRPEIYHDLMVDKLGAKDEPYSVFWLKSLMAAIYQHQTFDENSGHLFSRVPYRYFMFGSQGIGKSYALTNLSFGLEFNFSGNFTDKDTRLSLCANVLANADDIATQQIKMVDEIKSAITTPYFSLRLPYGRSNVRLRSRAVFVGSTNRLQAYTDTTGDRREFPIDLNVGMDTRAAEKHGKTWVTNQVANDKNYWLDLWATFLHDNDTAAIEPSPYREPRIDERRLEIIATHRRESDLGYILSELFNKQVPDDFLKLTTDKQLEALAASVELGEIDPFTGKASGSTRLSEFESLPATAIIKAVKREYGAKIARATIVEALSDMGYYEYRKQTRVFVKRQQKGENDNEQ